ncbi:MAG: DUF5060 domain-containing protein [Cytophagaceae bacterium]|nr:DUF5060 domain-containing protein [Cytophagaceae bacterium]
MTKSFFIALIFVLAIRANTIFAQGTISSITNITSTNVPLYGKFEAGASLTKNFTNPYDPEIVSIDVQFISPTGKQYNVFGFYYQDYQRLSTSPFWNPIVTAQPWRVRFSPNEIGNWSYIIKVKENNNTITGISSARTFTCTNSSNPGFVSIASNKRYFNFSNGTSFFGIAQDMWSYGGVTSPNNCDPAPCPYACYSQYVYPKYQTWISNFSQNGGNLIRVWMSPTSFELEWPEDAINTNILGNYTPRQYRAYDLDAVFDLAVQNNVYIHLVVMNPDQLGTSFIDPGAVDNGWNGNPYKINIPLTNFGEFFTNSIAKKHFKNKLRYIQSRWGYSPTLANYEIINELDWINHAGMGSNAGNMSAWCNEMATFVKSLHPSHLTNVSFAIGHSGESSGINYLPTMDFTNGHSYSGDQNVEYQRTYFAQNNLNKFNKPFLITEYGFGGHNCWVSEISGQQDFHNTLWSSTFSGSSTTAFYFGADVKFMNSCWGGSVVKNYKPLNTFLQNETFNSSHHTFKPAGNALSVYNSYTPALNQNRPPDAPTFDINGFAPPSWGLDVDGTLIHTDYLVTDITTNDDRNIEVFALKNQNRVIGWVHNKNHYWYNLPHVADNGQIPNPCTYLNNAATSSYPNNITPLINKTLTISNLRCNGQYRIEWYSTQYNYDINNDGINDDGGIIPSLTTFQIANNGSLTINIPNLQPIELNQKPYAPDYGFKIIYQNNFGIQNGKWLHDYTDLWVTPSTTQAAAKPTGDYALSANGLDVFFQGSDGYMQHFFWNSLTNKWSHDGLVASWWTQSANYKVAGKILVSSTGVFYKGADGRMQHYYWNGLTWVHDYTDAWVTPASTQAAAKPIGDYVLSANGLDVFFHGADGYMQHFFWNSSINKWSHDGLVASWWTQSVNYKVAGKILVSSTGVFYKGADGRMQHYYWNGSTWVHDYTDAWVTPASTQAAAKPIGDYVLSANGLDVFFHGADGYMQHFFWNSSINKWSHDGLVSSWWTQSTNYKVAGKILVSSMGVLYKGVDGRMQHYYWDYPCEYFGSGKLSNPNFNFQNMGSGIYNNDATSIEEFLSAYPNPSNEILNVVFHVLNKDADVKLILLDIFGKEISIIHSKQFETGKFSETISTNNLPNGIYFLRYINNDQIIQTIKININH